MDYITSSDIDYDNWKQIELPGSIDNIFETNDFDGAILIQKSVHSNRLLKAIYSLRLGAVSDMDFTYLNGELIGSTMGKPSRQY